MAGLIFVLTLKVFLFLPYFHDLLLTSKENIILIFNVCFMRLVAIQ